MKIGVEKRPQNPPPSLKFKIDTPIVAFFNDHIENIIFRVRSFQWQCNVTILSFYDYLN